MAAPTVYKWSDAGAPVLDRTNMTSLKNIFEACLVNGYGSKAIPSAGANPWSIPYSNTTSFVLKQGGTNTRKCCLKIGPQGSQGYYAEMEAAVDYSAISTPVDQWAGTETNDRISIGYSNSAARKIPWVIIATERAIFAQFGHNDDLNTPVLFDSNADDSMNNYHFFFGDYVPDDPALVVNQMVSFSSSTTSGTSYRTSLTGTALTTTSKKRCAGAAGNLSGEFPIAPMYTRAIDDAAIPAGGQRNDEFDPRYPNLLNGGLYLDRVKLVSQGVIMGEFPGLLFPIQSRPFPINGIIHEINGTGDYTGEKLYIFGTGDGQYFIRDGEWGVE